MKLEMKPVRQYRTPGYPSQAHVRENPELLEMMPQRWQKHMAMYTAIAMTATIGLTACAGQKSTTPKLHIPVFAHGDGRIGYGCLVVTPPIILSEEDAYEIITDEAGKRGVRFKNHPEDSGVGGDITGVFPATDLDRAGVSGTWEGTLHVDGFDEEHKIGFEYISMADMREWCSVSGGTASEFGYKVTAEELAKTVENTAVFYDPGAYPEYKYTEELKESGMEYNEYYEKRGFEMAEELLRQQVRDFLDWLAAEGVI